MDGDFTTLYDNLDYIANLEFVRIEPPTGRRKNSRMVLRWPPQVVGSDFSPGQDLLYSGTGGIKGRSVVSEISVAERELSITWGAFHEEKGTVPLVVARDVYYPPGAKLTALCDLAYQVLHPEVHGEPSRLALALLSAEAPRFAPGAGPRDGIFREGLDEIYPWIDHLDESVVAIQGPPGTGKTYSGSHLIHHLIKLGRRVGIMAMSGAAIDNLMRATVDVFEHAGDLDALGALRWAKPPDDPLAHVRYLNSSKSFVATDFNLLGGTSWFWANSQNRQLPVDVLVVDEAGQLALADALAATGGARSVVLLGDPLQLAQVSKAEHPGGAGASVLEHMLGEVATIPEDRGIFISVTRRMHPDICEFMSRQIYEGRLSAHESCATQTTEFGTGLRWLGVSHQGRSTESPEEADAVVDQIREMLATSWTDHHGVVRPLAPEDFMVVAPYNDQVRLIRRRCVQGGLAGVQVGTVDKFQGREAPVVFFTMTTSSSSDMPRGPEFLFSRNRLNVAVSRARCLAYLVCTEDLLDSRASDVDDMRLIATLSAFVEYAQDHPPTRSRVD